MREAMQRNIVEDRLPYLRSFDVLIQYLITLAVSDGFRQEEILKEVRSTVSYASVTDDEWNWLLGFITTGGEALTAYNEYRKVVVENGLFKVENKRIAFKHRLSIGAIVGDSLLYVKYVSGKFLGTIEEYFISSLKIGDVFWFAGQSLELVRIKEMEAHVRKSKKKTGKVPSWQGGRMPLSSQMSEMIRLKIDEAATGNESDEEMKFLKPLMQLQRERSHLPKKMNFWLNTFIPTKGIMC